jgi:lipoprotein signal peptidase
VEWQTALVAGLLLVPLADQALKVVLRRRLGTRSVPLGPVGRLEMVSTRIWLARGARGPGLIGMWTVWLLAAVAVTLLSARAPACGWFAGLLLGGSLSHGLESSVRGGVSDYVCPRYWPAFNLADVAITVGALGVGWNAVLTVRGLWS